VLLQLDPEHEVARGHPPGAGLTLAREPDLGAVGHAGGDAHAEGAAVDPQVALGAEDGVAQRDGHLGLEVLPLRRPGAAAAAEEVAEDRAEVEAAVLADVHPREVAEVERRPPAAPGVALPAADLLGALLVEAGAEGVGAELVVELAPLGVREDLEGRGDLLEPLLRLPVPRVHVRVELAGEAAVGLLDLDVVRGPRDAEDLVEIAVWHAGKVTRMAGQSNTHRAGAPECRLG